MILYLKKWQLLFCLIIASSLSSFSQEICNDGIDNDGNGLIDCSDSACSIDVACITPATDCTFQGTDFSFSVSGSPQVGYVDEFILTDLNGIIQATSLSTSFSGIAAGDYRLFHLNYYNTTNISGKNIGNFIHQIDGDCFEVSGGFTIKICPADVNCQLDFHVWLEGAFDESMGEMKTILNDYQLLPGQKPIFFLGTQTPAGQPFQNTPWNYAGTEGDNFDYQIIGSDKAGYLDEVVDWVLVSLRTSIMANSTFCTQAAWLLKDGSIYFPIPCNCNLSLGQAVYVVIEHRNHLPIMTPIALITDSNGLSFDFRSNQSYITFTGDGQLLLSTGDFAMFGANGDQGSFIGAQTDINANDEAIWTIFNSSGDTYILGDFNLDGDVNANDESFWLNNTGKSADVNFN